MIPAERNYHNLLAVVEALKTFRSDVDGVHSNLITDHKPNTFLDTQPNLSKLVQLLHYDIMTTLAQT